jgi:hypothetical protein
VNLTQKSAPILIRGTSGSPPATITLAAAGAIDTPNGVTLGIPIFVGDATVIAIHTAYTSTNNAGACGFVLYGANPDAFGNAPTAPTNTPSLSMAWEPISAWNLAGNGALTIAAVGGSPAFLGISVPNQPVFNEYPAVPNNTVQLFGTQFDVEAYQYVLALYAEYGAKGSPGSVLATLTYQTRS